MIKAIQVTLACIIIGGLVWTLMHRKPKYMREIEMFCGVSAEFIDVKETPEAWIVKFRCRNGHPMEVLTGVIQK